MGRGKSSTDWIFVRDIFNPSSDKTLPTSDIFTQLFERFRKHNVYLKANKCYFGFKELEFVGKVLSEEGLKISRTKIQSVLDFPLPTVGKQLKSFLGTVNYLRDFVHNHSIIVKPLHDLIANYDKTRRIVWTPETTAAFHEMKLQVSRCSTIHFMSDTAPITLHTDASDYGVGGYLFRQWMALTNLLLSSVSHLTSPNYVG